ncbi:MAG: nucleotidyltransferase domain-containing protein [Pseudomonadales bacterium]|nr:nucleotidyltransferase domain-containing protein [Pseudomonadales bacterium]
MSHEIYVFGSVTRGEVSPTSDVDMLVIPMSGDRDQYPPGWSIYSPSLIEEYFLNGRLFAWHLHLEARCIYTPFDIPFLESLGAPQPYITMFQDIDDLETLLVEALEQISLGTNSLVYELGIAYTAIRDIAMAASWSLLGRPCFSRRAPYLLPVPFPLATEAYSGAMLARHSSVRGIDIDFHLEKIAKEVTHAPLRQWVNSLKNFR